MLPPREACMAAKYKTTTIELKNGEVAKIYASPKVSDALTEFKGTMSLYDGVRLSQALDAVYRQGQKDGARAVFDQIESVKKLVPHAKPGRPSRKR
jgi:hypothetical protein